MTQRSTPAGHRGVPLHPLLVTVPIGCWTASLVFDLASRFVTEPGFLARGSTWLIGVGLVGAVLAAGAGLVDAMPIRPGTAESKVALRHMGLVMAAVVLYGIAFVVRIAEPADHAVPARLVALSVIGMVLVAVAGRFGATLTYRHGIRVTGGAD